MIDVNQLRFNISNEITKLSSIKNTYDNYIVQLSDINFKITNTTNLIELQEILSSILIESSNVMRDNAKKHFEKIVTDALQFIAQDSSYKFIIEESITRGKPSYEFYIESITDGNVTKLKPEESCGGGFVDIICVTLKVAYLVIFQSPRVMNASLLLDEPGKMISEQMSIKFAEYIKFLGKQFGLQITMITHKENITNVADETYIVTKNSNGISSINKAIDITSDQVSNDVVSILEGKEQNERTTEDIN